MSPLLLIKLAAFTLLAQPTKLQMMEEALDRVLMTHSVNYEKGNKMDGKIADVTITYTGNTVIDAKQDSLYYYVYGTYTFTKYSYVQAPNPLNGGTAGRAFNSSSSRSYVARIKSVLDDYRVQEVLVIEDPDRFDFSKSVYDSLKTQCDWAYPTLVYQSGTKKKTD